MSNDGATHSTSNAYWQRTAQSLLKELGSDLTGLTQGEVDQRLVQFGPNRLLVRTEATALRLFLNQFRSPIVLILLFATAISALLKDWGDALIILVIVLGSALLSFVQEYSAGDAVKKLRDQVVARTTALRDGGAVDVAVDTVVPGDVLLLAAGSLVPADGIVLEATDFYVNEAALTGETFPVQKQPGVVPAETTMSQRTNVVLMGSNVRSGSARVLVVKTGLSTVFGQVADRLALRPPETEFERGVRRFSYLLSEIMLVLVLIVFAVNVYFAEPVLDSLLFSVALAVGLTPQLLPAIISVNLAKGARIMAEAGVIVRRLESIENFGGMDVLCTDKTGTITEGVVHLDGALDMSGAASARVLELAYLNAFFETGLSNPLDQAILAQVVEQETPARKIDEIPYDFVRKRLSIVVVESHLNEGTPLLITKGALENVLTVCVAVREDAQTPTLDAPHLAQIRRRFEEWSAQGYRVLGVATRPLPVQDDYTRDAEAAMTFEGFLLFFDPPKAGVREAVADLQQLGVDLKVISGDNKLVVTHTAQEIGLPTAPILTGTEIDGMSEEALRHAVTQTPLFADVDPNQKERIILALKKLGHVVGYMGDGINDAPSLHAADVGISVNGAVDVAREAAGFVLLQKDLSILHQGIVLGRNTFANTLKYVFITTSANFGNMFSVAGASLFLPFLPMLPMQILLTNFLSDFPALTLAGDNVDNEMVEKPVRWDIRFIRNFMFTFGLVSSLFDYLTFFVLLSLLHGNVVQFRTGWFVESILTELLILLVVRTRRPFFQSRPGAVLLGSTILVAAVTLCLPYLFVNKVLGLAPLPPLVLVVLSAISVAYVGVSEVAKHYFYRSHLPERPSRVPG